MVLDKLKEYPKDKVLLLITLIAFVSYVILTMLGASIESELMAKSGYGVLDFEFAWTSDMIATIFAAWGEDGKQMEAIAVYGDFLYIPAYGFFMFGAILLASRRLEEGKIQDIGLIVCLTPLLAGIFDVIENINLLLMLSDESFIYSLSPLAASTCATIKFSLLFVGIIFFFVSLIILVVIKLRK